MTQRFLFVVSSHGELGSSGDRTGSWLEELAAPYARIAGARFDITIASPKGGEAPIDPMSLTEGWLTDDGRRFLAEVAKAGPTIETRRLADINPDEYVGMFLVGGAAGAWDFPLDRHIKALVEDCFAHGKVIGAICHGVLGVVQAVDANNEPLVKNRNLTSISNAEDVMMGLDRIVPVLPEEMLRKQRANYFCAAPLQNNVVVDPPFFTGQNPASAAALGEAIVAHLTREPREQEQAGLVAV